MQNERGCGCLIMLGAVVMFVAAGQANDESTPFGLMLAVAVLAAGFFVFLFSYRRREAL
jgi:hypothetical protein